MQIFKTIMPEGSEIRNYVNGGIAAPCTRGGLASGIANEGTANVMASENLSSFQNCIRRSSREVMSSRLKFDEY
jgi:hypothetical protein